MINGLSHGNERMEDEKKVSMEEAQRTLRRPQNLNREFTHVASEDHPKMNLITEFRACVLLEESHFAFVQIGWRASERINV